MRAGFADLLQRNIQLPHKGRFFPSGFPVEIFTTSRSVLDAAEESWGMETQLYSCAPLELRFVVGGADCGTLPPAPTWRAMGGTTVFASDAANFGICDRVTRAAQCWLEPAGVADRAWFRWYYLEAMAYTLITQCEAAAVHAACVALNGKGVLLCGRSGMGKSTLAYVCGRRGWTFVSDDGVLLPWKEPEGLVVGHPHRLRFRPEASTLFPELKNESVAARPNGKLDLELTTAGVPGFQTARQCVVHSIVFLCRGAEDAGELIPVPRNEAFIRMAGDTPLYDRPVMKHHALALRRLLRAPAFELRYVHAEDAAERLKCSVLGVRGVFSALQS